MQARLLTILCLLSWLVLEVGCRINSEKMEIQSDHSRSDPQDNRSIVYCWFVEDNGAGKSGYVLMNTRVGRPLLPSEHLFTTVQELRRAIRAQEPEDPIIIPKHPDWVPEAWKVRDLNTNEVGQMGFSGRTRQH